MAVVARLGNRGRRGGLGTEALPYEGQQLRTLSEMDSAEGESIEISEEKYWNDGQPSADVQSESPALASRRRVNPHSSHSAWDEGEFGRLRGRDVVSSGDQRRLYSNVLSTPGRDGSRLLVLLSDSEGNAAEGLQNDLHSVSTPGRPFRMASLVRARSRRAVEAAEDIAAGVGPLPDSVGVEARQSAAIESDGWTQADFGRPPEKSRSDSEAELVISLRRRRSIDDAARSRRSAAPVEGVPPSDVLGSLGEHVLTHSASVAVPPALSSSQLQTLQHFLQRRRSFDFVEDEEMQDEIQVGRVKLSVTSCRSADLEPLVLGPNSALLALWDVVLVAAVLYTALISPWQFAFEPLDVSPAIVALNVVADVIFAAELVGRFCVAVPLESGRWVAQRPDIARMYFRSTFARNLLCAVPFEALRGGLASHSRIARGLSVLRCIRLLRVGVVSDLAQKASFLSENSFRIVKLLFVYFLIAHWTGCGYYFLGSLEASDLTEDPFEQPWILRSNFANMRPTSFYITAVYWSMTTLVSGMCFDKLF